jgi:hypothetical protein
LRAFYREHPRADTRPRQVGAGSELVLIGAAEAESRFSERFCRGA